MKYYIADQVKQTLKQKGVLYFLLCTAVLCVAANVSMLAFRTIYGINDGSYGYNLLPFAEWCFVIPYYSTIFIVQIVFGKECPNPRIRNKVTIGLNRIHLYLGQFFAELIVAAFFCVASCVLFIGITYLFMFADHSIELWAIGDFLQKALIAVPLWIAGIAISHMLFYMCKKKRFAYGLFAVMIVIIPRIIIIFAAQPFNNPVMNWFKNYILLTPRFNELPYFYTLNIPQIIVASVVYTVLACMGGIYAYNKKEY